MSVKSTRRLGITKRRLPISWKCSTSVLQTFSQYYTIIILLIRLLLILRSNRLLLVLHLNHPLRSFSRISSLTMLRWPTSAHGRNNFVPTTMLRTWGLSLALNSRCTTLTTAWMMFYARVDREATWTTPVYPPIHGLMTCISILDSTFLESNPIHLRRKQFFNTRQKGSLLLNSKRSYCSFSKRPMVLTLASTTLFA